MPGYSFRGYSFRAWSRQTPRKDICAYVATEAYLKPHPVKQKPVAWQKTWPLVQHSPDRGNKNVDGPTRRR